MVVARDIAHAKLKERLDRGEGLPDYIKDHPVYYAGPAKTPAGHGHRQLRPDHGRADGQLRRRVPGAPAAACHAGQGQPLQAPSATPARRMAASTSAASAAPAARLAQDCIRKVEVLEYPELGMEAVWRIEVEDFPAFIVIDDKGNDFYDGME